MSRLSVEFFGQKRAVSREVFDSIRRLATSSNRIRRYEQSLGRFALPEQSLDSQGDCSIPTLASNSNCECSKDLAADSKQWESSDGALPKPSKRPFSLKISMNP